MARFLVPSMFVITAAVSGCGATSVPDPPIKSAPVEKPAAKTTSPQAATSADEADKSFTDEKLLLTFPPTLGHLTFGGYESFDEPGMGYSVRYNTTDNMKVDVYVYDKGLLSIPDGHTDPAVAKELAASDATIRFYEQQRRYRDVEELGRGTYPSGAGPDDVIFLFSRYQYHQSAREGVNFTGQRISETFLRGFRDHFLKIRVSYPKATAEVSVADREILLQHLSNTIKTQNAERVEKP